jgi:hypothetical protein
VKRGYVILIILIGLAVANFSFILIITSLLGELIPSLNSSFMYPTTPLSVLGELRPTLWGIEPYLILMLSAWAVIVFRDKIIRSLS